MKNFFISIISFMIAVMGYTQNTPHSIKDIEIDCKNISEEIELLSKFNVDFIPLKAGLESFIRRIEKVIYEDDHIVVWDRTLNTIIVFNKEGSFLRKIKYGGKGPGEFLSCYDVDVQNNKLYVLSYREIIVFDLDLNFQEKIALNKVYWKFLIDDEWVYFYNMIHTPIYREKVGVANLASLGKSHPLLFENRQLGMYHPVEVFNFCNNSEEILFHYLLTDTIYSLYKNKVQPKYILDFKGRKFDKHAYDKIPNNEMAAMKLDEELRNLKHPYKPIDFIKNSIGIYLRFVMDNNSMTFFQNSSKSINSLSKKSLIDGIEISLDLIGFTEETLIFKIDPWEISDKLKSNLKNKGYSINEDSNPLLMILSAK
ncbi:6-bladed beta-propeller [Bacteroidota bacterium]